MSLLRVPLMWPQATRVAMVAAALVAGGCASQQAATQDAIPAESAIQSASFTFPQGQTETADDVTQPWSPGYGSNPTAGGPLPARTSAPAGRPRLATMDADFIIRHAVAAHEMRRQ